MPTRHLIVTGLVQGVGYRDALCHEASKCGVTGWVRNRRDGSVEIVIQGDAAALEALITWAWRGPPLARVDSIRTETAGADQDRPHTEFERRPTA
jgi:acylphosphatase